MAGPAPSAYRNVARELDVTETRAIMNSHFAAAHANAKYHDGWDELWNRDFLPWDKLAPSPALPDTLENHAELIGSSALIGPDGKVKRRKRALVPGCGRGVDVLLLQSYGYDVVGLEYSQRAYDECKKYAEEMGQNEMYRTKNETVGIGSRVFVKGDFYNDEWIRDAQAGLSIQPEDLREGNLVFELIYDYTFFCAMHVSMRPAWAKRTSDLLAKTPQANLICLEFPVTKPPGSGGPPFSSPPKVYMEHLSHPGEEVPYNSAGEVNVNPFAESGRGALERVGHWHPVDTHMIGKDANGNVNDYISVWRHR